MTGGSYFVLEGADGCGKSAQAASLTRWLEAQGASVLHLREPGSTPLGESLRRLLLDPAGSDLRDVTEALLFTAARAELVQKVVEPALAEGRIVIAERCFASTLVYQGLARDDGLDADWLVELTRRAHGPCMPARIFVLDVPAEIARSRRRGHDEDRFENRGGDYHERVRRGYLSLPRTDPTCVVIDASRDFDAVQRELRERVIAELR
ncbi:MAG: hypothetical protein Fur0037_21480 [Planctomycetota bacterium]